MNETNKYNLNDTDNSGVVVDITTYQTEGPEKEDEKGPRNIDYSPGILRFIDALVLDMVNREWKGKEASE